MSDSDSSRRVEEALPSKSTDATQASDAKQFESKLVEQMQTRLRTHFSTGSTLLNGALVALIVLWFLPIEDEAGVRFEAAREYRLAKDNWQSKLSRLSTLHSRSISSVSEELSEEVSEEVTQKMVRDCRAEAVSLIQAMENISAAAARYAAANEQLRDAYGEAGIKGEVSEAIRSTTARYAAATEQARDTYVEAGPMSRAKFEDTMQRAANDLPESLNKMHAIVYRLKKATNKGGLLTKLILSYNNEDAWRVTQEVKKLLEENLPRKKIQQTLQDRIGFKLPFADQKVPMQKVVLTWSLAMSLTLLWGIHVRRLGWSQFGAINTAKAPSRLCEFEDFPWWMGSLWCSPSPTENHSVCGRRGWGTIGVGVLVCLVLGRLAWLEHAHFHLILLCAEPPNLTELSFAWNYASYVMLGACVASTVMFVRISGRNALPPSAISSEPGEGMTTRQFLAHTFGAVGGLSIAGLTDCMLSRVQPQLGIDGNLRDGKRHDNPRFVLKRPQKVKIDTPTSSVLFGRPKKPNDEIIVYHFAFSKDAFTKAGNKKDAAKSKRSLVLPSSNYILRPRKPKLERFVDIKPDDLLNLNGSLPESKDPPPKQQPEPAHISLLTVSYVCEHQAISALKQWQNKSPTTDMQAYRKSCEEALAWMLCSIRHRIYWKDRVANRAKKDKKFNGRLHVAPDFRSFDLAARLAGHLDDKGKLSELIKKFEEFKILNPKDSREAQLNRQIGKRLMVWKNDKWKQTCNDRLNPLKWHLPGVMPKK